MATAKAAAFRGWIPTEIEREVKLLLNQERKKRNAEIRASTMGTKEHFYGSKCEFPTGTILARHFTILKRYRPLGKRGTRSYVYICKSDNSLVAIKIARRVSDDPQIIDQTYLTVYREFLVWKELEKFLASMFYFNAPLVEPKLDPRAISYRALSFNFEQLMRKFSVLPIGLCLLAAADTLCAIKQLHDCGYLHRDIHPRHFCLGFKEGGTLPNIVYLVDLSHAERFVFFDPTVEVPHVEFSPDPIYSSTSVIEGKQYTRRDDLLSWIYSILAFRQCHFWRKYPMKQIPEIKDGLAEDRLVVGYGPAVGPILAAILCYLRQLPPYRKPDYSFLMQCIVTGLKSYCNNGVPPSLPEKLTHFWKLDKYKATMSDEEAFASRYKIITQEACFAYLDEAPEKVSSLTMQTRINGWFDQLTKESHLKMFNLIESRMKIPEAFPSVLDISDNEADEEDAAPEEDAILPPQQDKLSKDPVSPVKPKKEKADKVLLTCEEFLDDDSKILQSRQSPQPPPAPLVKQSPKQSPKPQAPSPSKSKPKSTAHKKEKTREEDAPGPHKAHKKEKTREEDAPGPHKAHKKDRAKEDDAAHHKSDAKKVAKSAPPKSKPPSSKAGHKKDKKNFTKE